MKHSPNTTRRLGFALSMLLALFLAACGGGGTPEVAGTDGQIPEDPPAAPTPPSITAVTAETTYKGIPAGLEQGGTLLTIRGAGFAQGDVPQVFIGDTEATPTVLDDETMQVSTPPGDAGLVTVRAQTSAGSAMLGDAFEYRAPMLFFAIDHSTGIQLYQHAPGSSFLKLGGPIQGYRIQSLAMAPDGILMAAAIKQETVDVPGGGTSVVDGATYYFDVDQETGEASNFRKDDSATLFHTRDMTFVDGTPMAFLLRRGFGVYPPGTLFGRFARIENDQVSALASWDVASASHGGLANVGGRLFLSRELASGLSALSEIGPDGQSLRLVSTVTKHRALTSLGGTLWGVEYLDGDSNSRLVKIDPESGDAYEIDEDNLASADKLVGMAGNFQ